MARLMLAMPIREELQAMRELTETFESYFEVDRNSQHLAISVPPSLASLIKFIMSRKGIGTADVHRLSDSSDEDLTRSADHDREDSTQSADHDHNTTGSQRKNNPTNSEVPAANEIIKMLLKQNQTMLNLMEQR